MTKDELRDKANDLPLAEEVAGTPNSQVLP